jgi:predicted phage terminase large subunit-like protein
MARWHPEDLIAELVRDGWSFVRLAALDDETGLPLWPERWTREALEEKRSRVGDFTWESLYQGRPRPRGAVVFGPPTTYTELPKVYRSAGGLDLSYAAKSSAHWSIAVRLLVAGGKLYVADVLRRKVAVPQFRLELHAIHSHAPATRWRWYTSSTEVGLGQMFNEPPHAVPVVPVLARADKLTRALPCAAAWNRGDVLVPQAAPWLDEFLAVVTNFTGTGGEDDDVDALVGAYDEATMGNGRVSSEPAEPTRLGAWHATEL